MRSVLFLASLAINSAVIAVEFPEKAGLYLVNPDQQETKIGDVVFSNTGNSTTSVQVSIDHGAFTDHFLSMRPFRCIEGEREWFCYLEYPYDLHSVISMDDLSDLEYQLLFISKTPAEFGIDAWNGLYYKLEVQTDGTITGNLLEGDLNSLQSPPTEKYAKPIDLSEFIPSSHTKRLFPILRIY